MRSALLSLVVKGLFQGSGCGSLSAHLASWLRLQDGWCCFLTTRLAVDVSQLVLKLVISVTLLVLNLSGKWRHAIHGPL